MGVGEIGNFTRSKLDEWGYEVSEDEWQAIEDRLIDQLMASGYISLDDFKSLVEGVMSHENDTR